MTSSRIAERRFLAQRETEHRSDALRSSAEQAEQAELTALAEVLRAGGLRAARDARARVALAAFLAAPARYRGRETGALPAGGGARPAFAVEISAAGACRVRRDLAGGGAPAGVRIAAVGRAFPREPLAVWTLRRDCADIDPELPPAARL